MQKTAAEKIWEMDKNHFIHPYTDFAKFKDEGSQVISQAQGNYVADAQGKKYLDGIAGLWCVNIGHGRADMADAIAEQSRKMGYYNPFGHCTNEPASVLAAKLAELAPGSLNHVFYTCGGSTANDSAIRLVHYYNNLRGKPNKKVILSRVDAYHGSTYVAANLTGIHATKNAFDRIANDWIQHVSAANMYRRPKGAEKLSEQEYCDFLANEFENRILQIGAENVAAFIAEPIMGAGGVLVAPKGYHQAIYKLCKKHDVLYIADEVVTAFGRLGHFFASQEVFGIEPDIIVTAKGISSGYIPLGAAIISSQIYNTINKPQCEGGLLSMGFTYSGHPVACAAALKNIEIMEQEAICQQVQQHGRYFAEQLKTLSKWEIVGDVRGSHYMMGIEFVSNKDKKTPFPAEAGIANMIFDACRERGLIVRPIGNIVVLSPPLTLTREQIDTAIGTLHAAVETTIAKCKSAGWLKL